MVKSKKLALTRHHQSRGVAINSLQPPYTPKTEAEQPASVFGVRGVGLEPTRLSTPDPKSDAATNYAISANL